MAAPLECTRQVAPLPVRESKPGGSGESARRAQEVTYPSVEARVLGVYDAYDDASRAVPLATIAKHSKAGQFDSRRLRAFQSFVYHAGGSGLSGGDVDHLWNLFHEWESKTPAKEGEPRRLRDVFNNPHALRQALGHDIEEALLADEWMACEVTELEETYEGYYRPCLRVLLEALKAPKVRYWEKGAEDEGPSECRETPFDGDAFRICEETIMREHGPGAFVLGVHAFSDSCAVSSSGGKCPTSFY